MNNNKTTKTVKKDKINIEIKTDSNTEEKVVKRKRGRPRKNKDETDKEKSKEEQKSKEKESNKSKSVSKNKRKSTPRIILLENKDKNTLPYNIEYEGLDIKKYRRDREYVLFNLYCRRCKKQYYDENIYANHMVFDHFDILESVKYSYLKEKTLEEKYEYYDKIESTKRRIIWEEIKKSGVNKEIMYELDEKNDKLFDLHDISRMTFYNISNNHYDLIISYLEDINIKHNILTINNIINIFHILLKLKENYNYVLHYDYDACYRKDVNESDIIPNEDLSNIYKSYRYGLVMMDSDIHYMELNKIVCYKINAMVNIIEYIITNENIKFKYSNDPNKILTKIKELCRHKIIFTKCTDFLVSNNGTMLNMFTEDIKLLYNFDKYARKFDFNYILNNDKITKEQYVEQNKRYYDL